MLESNKMARRNGTHKHQVPELTMEQVQAPDADARLKIAIDLLLRAAQRKPEPKAKHEAVAYEDGR